MAALTASLRRWLASGHCQSASGAFFAWHDATTSQPAYEYPEITGYALTHFARHAASSAEETSAAQRAAEWLAGRLEAGDYSARERWDGGAAYTFDLAVIATGLMTFGARVGRDRYVTLGLALARALREQLHSDTGLAALQADPHGPRVASARMGWSTEGQAHLLKVVQCLLLADALGQAGALDSAALLVRQRLGWQREDGRFVTQPEEALTMFHPHLYALEGLWIWGSARGDHEALARARAGLAWTWERQLPSGGFPRAVRVGGAADHQRERIEQSDATCQAVRLALALGMEPPGLPAALARLGEIAVEDAGGAALLYQPASPQRHLNAWVTLFGAQASEIAAEGAAAITWQTLV